MFESTLFALGFLFLAWVVWLPEIQPVSIPIVAGWYVLSRSPSAGMRKVVWHWAEMVRWHSARMGRAEVPVPPPDLCPHEGTNRFSGGIRIISDVVMDSTAPFFRQLSGVLGDTPKRWLRLLSRHSCSSFSRRF